MSRGVCPDCDGTGHYGGRGSFHDHPTGKPCERCHGRGTIDDTKDRHPSNGKGATILEFKR